MDGDAAGNGLALITGAAKGIGRGVALSLVRDGWAVAIADIDGDALASTLAELREHGPAEGWEIDLANSPGVERFVAAADEWKGPVRALINNVIDARPGPFLELSEADWRRGLDVSLTSYFLCGQRVARLMVDHGGGRIVNMSSGSAERGFPRTTSYACAKGAVNSLTRVMATELAQHGIAVNTLTTGPVMTESFGDIAATADGIEARRRRVPMGRLGEVADVTGLVHYLLSPEAAWTTGALFHVDGGSNNAALVQNVQQ